VRHTWFKLPSKIVEFGRINNRMHNKLLVTDNLGDDYRRTQYR